MSRRAAKKPTVKQMLRFKNGSSIHLAGLDRNERSIISVYNRINQNRLDMLEDALCYVCAASKINLKELKEKYVLVKEENGLLTLTDKNERGE